MEPSAHIINLIDTSLGDFKIMGGPGSGHWRHAGRKGKKGGSAPSKGKAYSHFSKSQLGTDISKERLGVIEKTGKALPQEHLDTVSGIQEFPLGARGAAAKCDLSGGIVLNSDQEQTEGQITHEIGHAVMYASGFGYPDRPDHHSNFYKIRQEKMEKLTMMTEEKMEEAVRNRVHFKGFPTSYSQWSVEELFAESYMQYTKAPTTLQRLAPDIYDYMKDEVFGGIEYTK